MDVLHGVGVMVCLGLFHMAFSRLDIATDFAIGKFLSVTPEEAHLITAGMMFGRKARLLAGLISRSDHPRKAAILSEFNAIRGNNKREILLHGHIYQQNEEDRTVSFIERSVSGEFKATVHTFGLRDIAN